MTSLGHLSNQALACSFLEGDDPGKSYSASACNLQISEGVIRLTFKVWAIRPLTDVVHERVIADAEHDLEYA